MIKICKRKNVYNDIIPPDGGWGWLICIAGGLSLFLTFSIRKTFGLLFRESFEKLGITNSEITTIINFHIAIASFQGFLYGPIYSYMSIRQVAIASAILIVFGIFLLAFVETFTGFVIAFSIIYGLGTGFNKSATFLSLNTYFEKLRRRAHSLTLTLSAIGPMVMPQTVNALLYIYGVKGTVIIFSAITMNLIAFGLIYHPVHWHAKKLPKEIFIISNHLNNNNNNNKSTEDSTSKKCVNETNTIVEEDSYNYISQNNNQYQDHNYKVFNHKDQECGNINYGYKKDNLNYDRKKIDSSNQQLNDSELKELRININDIDIKFKNNEGLVNNKEIIKFNYNNSEKTNFKFLENHKNDSNENNLNENNNNKTKDNKKKLNYFKKISSLFDLDLLCDLSYLNIIFGIAFANVCELNFTLLTPFILSDFGFENHEIAAAMSTRAFTDLISRFLLPYITIKIKWNSRIFFLIGMCGSILTRIAIAQNPSYLIHLILFGLTGVFTSIRSIFINLILPEYLPLIKLASGTGLQQIPAGLFALIMGPVIGLIRDATNYSFVLYVLSMFSALTIILWTIELVWIKMKTKVFKLK